MAVDEPVSIRRVEPTDLDTLAQIHSEAFGVEAWDNRSIADILAMPAGAGLVATGAGFTVGFLLFTLVAEDAELLTLAVDKKHRRLGIGRALVNGFLLLARAAGATQALLEVATDNPAAQRLYSRLGFKHEATRVNYYRRSGGRYVSAHLLRLLLAGGNNRPG